MRFNSFKLSILNKCLVSCSYISGIRWNSHTNTSGVRNLEFDLLWVILDKNTGQQQQGATPAPIYQGYGQPQGNQGYNNPPGQGYNPGHGAPPNQGYDPGYGAPPNQGYDPGYGAPPNQGYNPGYGAPPSQAYGSSSQGLPGGGMPMPNPSTSPSFSQQPPHGNNYQTDFPQPSHHPPQQIGQPPSFPVPDFNSAGQHNNFNFPPQPPPQGMGQPSLFPAPNFSNAGRQSNLNLPSQPPPQNQALFNQPPPTQQAPPSQPLPPGASSFIPVSNFSGRKKALLIGINYYGTKAALRGCINDVKNIKDFICRHYSFSTDSMVILTDDQKDNPTRIPTRENIIQAMKWLVSDARPNDSLFFHFSGHGSQQEDKDGDEDDGFDETICPVDYNQSGMIVDDEMNAIMVQPLPPGCRLTAIFDCCHSGTALDLPYTYDQHGKINILLSC
ncbi:Ca(2+)-dependent cysteine protease [Entomophthora muscae]|uniref:Ca(2+)-dependent cysteine protease n=1 Tax=Entomophthora muscae TaxID=34485 RepID=A0ACC2S6R1_9FUNG|nr:Ca(2+)-dependent cysteine protease [Entomophthora muscae]